jgi:hypothetical protein
MYEQIIAGVGLVLLLVLCLPFAAVSKLVTEVYAWGLRLILLALIGAAAYLWLRPEQLPEEVTDTLSNMPWLRGLLPEPGTPYFGISMAALAVAVLLPLLAVLDISRKSVGRRGDTRVTEPVASTSLNAASTPRCGTGPVARRIDRRAAADVLAKAGCHTQAAPATTRRI